MTDRNNRAGKEPGVRLFVDAPFAAAAELQLAGAQAHYLCNVLRFKAGDTLLVFNGREGEWRALCEWLNEQGFCFRILSRSASM